MARNKTRETKLCQLVEITYCVVSYPPSDEEVQSR